MSGVARHRSSGVFQRRKCCAASGPPTSSRARWSGARAPRVPPPLARPRPPQHPRRRNSPAAWRAFISMNIEPPPRPHRTAREGLSLPDADTLRGPSTETGPPPNPRFSSSATVCWWRSALSAGVRLPAGNDRRLRSLPTSSTAEPMDVQGRATRRKRPPTLRHRTAGEVGPCAGAARHQKHHLATNDCEPTNPPSRGGVDRMPGNIV